MPRRLVLKKESLTELTPAELGTVHGAALTPHCPTNYCVPSWYVTCRVSEVLADCPSGVFC